MSLSPDSPTEMSAKRERGGRVEVGEGGKTRKPTGEAYEVVYAYVLSTSFSIRTSFMWFVGTVLSAYNTH